MKRPTLSIVIPVFNAPLSIKSIVSSIVNEPFKDFELILVDDGSTDDTLSVLRSLASKDKRIIILSQNNKGPSSARNLGLQRSSGDYVQFFDSDDNIEPESLHLPLSFMQDSAADVVVSGWNVINDSGDLIISVSPKYETIEEKDKINYFVKSIGEDGRLYNLWNKLFRLDVIKKHNIKFREDLRFGEDIIFSMDYIKYANSLVLIPNVTYSYQSNSSTSVFSSSSLVPLYRRLNNKALEKFVGRNRDTELDDLFNWVKWRWLLSYWLIVAGSEMRTKEKIKLIKELSKGSYVVAKNSKVIGVKKLILEHTANILRRIPYVALLISKLMVFVKNTIIKLKSSTKS